MQPEIDAPLLTFPPPALRLLRPEDFAPVDPLVDLMSFSAAIFAAAGMLMLIAALARRRRGAVDVALRRGALSLRLGPRQVAALVRIAPLAGGSHPVGLLLSRDALARAIERARIGMAAGALRLDERGIAALERSVMSVSRE